MQIEQIKVFTEYVLRPLMDDCRSVLEKAKELNLPISEGLIRHLYGGFLRYHLLYEILRALTYVIVTVLACQTIKSVL